MEKQISPLLIAGGALLGFIVIRNAIQIYKYTNTPRPSIGKMYDTKPPGLFECANGRFSDHNGRGACAANGGLLVKVAKTPKSKRKTPDAVVAPVKPVKEKATTTKPRKNIKTIIDQPAGTSFLVSEVPGEAKSKKVFKSPGLIALENRGFKNNACDFYVEITTDSEVCSPAVQNVLLTKSGITKRDFRLDRSTSSKNGRTYITVKGVFSAYEGDVVLLQTDCAQDTGKPVPIKVNEEMKRIMTEDDIQKMIRARQKNIVRNYYIVYDCEMVLIGEVGNETVERIIKSHLNDTKI